MRAVWRAAGSAVVHVIDSESVVFFVCRCGGIGGRQGPRTLLCPDGAGGFDELRERRWAVAVVSVGFVPLTGIWRRSVRVSGSARTSFLWLGSLDRGRNDRFARSCGILLRRLRGWLEAGVSLFVSKWYSLRPGSRGRLAFLVTAGRPLPMRVRLSGHSRA